MIFGIRYVIKIDMNKNNTFYFMALILGLHHIRQSEHVFFLNPLFYHGVFNASINYLGL